MSYLDRVPNMYLKLCVAYVFNNLILSKLTLNSSFGKVFIEDVDCDRDSGSPWTIHLLCLRWIKGIINVFRL